MDGHALLGDFALYSSICGDGGPRHYRHRGKPLPEKYLPGRFLSSMRADAREDVVRAANDRAAVLAPWFVALVASCDEEPRVALPAPPVDRRWSCRGRWSAPPASAPRRARAVR
jgi:hypothetical protein